VGRDAASGTLLLKAWHLVGVTGEAEVVVVIGGGGGAAVKVVAVAVGEIGGGGEV
jgi:hypothetical protein